LDLPKKTGRSRPAPLERENNEFLDFNTTGTAYTHYRDHRRVRCLAEQYRLAKQKHDIDIFNRRMQVYKVTVILLVKCERTYSISEDDFYEWRRDVADAEFLFGQEILDLFEDIEKTSTEIIRSDE
jgi:hypothetical protein